MTDKLYNCYREIERLEKAVIYLSKEVVKYKDDK